jgi:hypothetical protein
MAKLPTTAASGAVRKARLCNSAEELKSKLISFYRKYNPSKIAPNSTGSENRSQHPSEVVRWYFPNKQEALNEKLRKIYGDDLTTMDDMDDSSSSANIAAGGGAVAPAVGTTTATIATKEEDEDDAIIEAARTVRSLSMDKTASPSKSESSATSDPMDDTHATSSSSALMMPALAPKAAAKMVAATASSSSHTKAVVQPLPASAAAVGGCWLHDLFWVLDTVSFTWSQPILDQALLQLNTSTLAHMPHHTIAATTTCSGSRLLLFGTSFDENTCGESELHELAISHSPDAAHAATLPLLEGLWPI